jgi:hypothetical protein
MKNLVKNNISLYVKMLHIVTVATEEKYYFPFLKYSCKKNGISLTVLGMGEKWLGFNWRYQKMLEFLKTIDQNDLVCFVDGYDVICSRNLSELPREFERIQKKTGCKIVVGKDNIVNTLNKIFSYFTFGKCNEKYLNAGTYIGYSKDIREIIQQIYALNPRNNADDQVLMTKFCSKNPADFYIDEKGEIFLCIVDALNDIDPQVIYNTQKNNNNNKGPFFIHANGYGFLDNTIKRLGYDANHELEKIDIPSQYKNDFLLNKIIKYIWIFLRDWFFIIVLFLILFLFFLFLYIFPK